MTTTAAWYADSCLEPPLEAAPFRGREEAAIGIVGGGLAGLALALSLAERGAAPVLLEARMIAGGASGQNGGLLSAGFTRDYASLRHRLGEAAASRLFQASITAIGLVERRLAAGAIACRPRYGVLEASWFDRPRALEAYVATQNERFDRRLAFWPRQQLRTLYRSARYHDGIFDPQARHLDPLALSRGYARLARGKGARLHEHSPVTRIVRPARSSSRTSSGRASGWRVLTAGGGQLEVKDLVLATNAGDGLDPRLRRGLLPVHT